MGIEQRSLFKFLAWIVVSFVVQVPFLGAQDEKPGQPGQEDPENVSRSDPRPTVTEYVFVEGSLPYVPTANTIVSKLPLALRWTPNNVGIVTAPLFREQYDRVVSESLVNVSNVNIQTQSGVHDFFYIRGFDSLSSGLMLTDGAAEPEATFYQLYNVERVEVLKGPAGFLYGSNPLAGAVNLVRKQPTPTSGLDFGATFGSYDNYEGTFDWNASTEDGSKSFRLNGLFRDQGSYRDGKEGCTTAINPAFSWQFDDTGRMNVNFEYVGADFTPDSGIPVLGDNVASVDRKTNYQSPLDRSEQDILRFQADFEKVLSPSITIRDKFYRRDLDWVSSGTLFNGIDPRAGLLVRTFLELDDRQALTGNQLEAIFSFDTGGLRHSLLTGFEVTHLTDEFTLDVNLLAPVNPLDPSVGIDSAPFPLPGAGFAGDARSFVAAPYVIDQLQFGEKFHVLIGGRVDNFDFEDQASGRETNDTEFSPMVGLLASPHPELSIYANYSRSFAPPSARAFGALMPERSTQYEAGVKKGFSSFGAEATFAVYQLERDNIAIPDDNGFTQQIGNQRSRGFEVDFAAAPVRDVRVFVSYAFNDSELTNFAESFLVSVNPPIVFVVDRTGNRAAFAPKHILNFWLSKDLSENWGIGGGGRFVSDQFIAEDNAFAIDAVMTFDAMVYYDFGMARLRLNLRNLTNREYYLRGFGATSVIPAPPFTAYLGVDFRL